MEFLIPSVNVAEERVSSPGLSVDNIYFYLQSK